MVPQRRLNVIVGVALAASFVLLAFVALRHGLPPQTARPAAASLTATKADALATDVDGDGKVDPGDTLRYTVNIGAVANATAVAFNDTLDANETLQGTTNVSPLALDDSYTTIGNTLLEVGVAAGANPAVHVSSNVLANDREFLGDVGTLTMFSHTNPANGTLVSFNADGTFSYRPNAGFAGTDSFTYTLKDTGGLTGTGTVSISISQMVWYVKNNSVAGGTGQSDFPFDTLAEAETASAANDYIYVFAGNGTTTGQSLGIALKSGQHLVGEGVALSIPVSVNGGPNPTVLRAAGSQPLLDNTAAGGNGVSAPDVIPTEIVGLSLQGVANAIDVTLTGASTGTLAIKNNTIRGAGQEGIDINMGGSGTLTLDVQTNTWNTAGTHTGNGFDARRTAGTLRVAFSGNTNILSAANGVFIDGGAIASTAVTAFSSNTVHQNTVGTGMSISNVTFDATPGGAFDQVAGGTTTVGISGNGVGAAGVVMSNVAGDLAFTDLDIVADSGAGLQVTGTGAVNVGAGTGTRVTVGAGVATIAATGGPAADINGATVDLQLTSLTSTNSATTGVSLVNVADGTTAATFSAGSGSAISNPTGTDFNISGGNATVTYDGTITDDVGTLVSVASTSGDTKTFRGAITDGDDGDGSGVSLTSNTGATINFQGGLVLSTGSNPAFAATGGGTVNVCDENPCVPGATGALVNKITTMTGTALNVASTNIGANDLEFKSISANGATKGISLNATGTGAGNGGLKVKGTGTTDASGGTIQNISVRGGEFITTKNLSLKNMDFTNANTTDGGTCTDLSTAACNAAIYLSGVSTVAIDNANITGTTAQEAINGLNVSAFTFTNSTAANCGSSGSVEEGCIKMRELTGTSSITGSELSFPGQDVVEIVNTAGPALTLNVDSSIFRDSQSSSAGGNGLQARSQGSASMVLNVTNSSFLRIRTNGLQATAINTASNDVDVTTSTFDTGTGTMIGLDLDADNTGTLVFNVQNNPKIYARNGPAINVFGDTNASINGRINNNPDVQVKNNVGSNVGSGIRSNINKDATAKIEVKNNVVNVASDDAGIDLSAIGKTTANPGGATNTLDATVTGNNVTIGATSTYGIVILDATNAGDTNALCANVATNAITRNPSSIASFRARVPSVNGFFRMQGFVTNPEATWNGNSNTPVSVGGSEVSFGGSGTFGACTAALPTNPGPN